MEIQRGFRGKLKNYLDLTQEFTIDVAISGPIQYSSCCMAFTSQGELYCSDYIIWSGHTRSANKDICYQDLGNGAAAFTLNLGAIPKAVQKLLILVNVEDDHVMKDIELHMAEVKQGGKNIFTFPLHSSDFKNEKLIVCFEIYKKNSEWRLAALSCGYNKTIGEIVKDRAQDSSVIIEEQPKYTCSLNNCQAWQDSPPTDALKSTDPLTASNSSAALSLKRDSRPVLSINGHTLSEPFQRAETEQRKVVPKILPTKVIPIPIHRRKK
ncbi:MAG: TerD family protein [Candidatus Bruticola sp.]